MYEWNFDYFHDHMLPCDDCANTTVGSSRESPGGAWDYPYGTMRISARSSMGPAVRWSGRGFRCVKAQ